MTQAVSVGMPHDVLQALAKHAQDGDTLADTMRRVLGVKLTGVKGKGGGTWTGNTRFGVKPHTSRQEGEQSPTNTNPDKVSVLVRFWGHEADRKTADPATGPQGNPYECSLTVTDAYGDHIQLCGTGPGGEHLEVRLFFHDLPALVAVQKQVLATAHSLGGEPI